MANYAVPAPDDTSAQGYAVPAPDDAPAAPNRAMLDMSPVDRQTMASHVQNPPEAPHTTAAGLLGAANRGLLPYAAGAAGGAGLGALAGGVGAVPGAVAGVAAVGATKLVIDPVVASINGMFGTNYTLPTDALEHLMTKLGIPEPKTEAERIVRTAAEAAAGAGGQVALGQTLTRTGFNPAVQAVGQTLASQPWQQIISAAGSGASSQGAAEAGAGPGGQMAAGLAGGLLTSHVARPRTITAAPPIPQAMTDAENAGIKVMTTDVNPPRTFPGKFAQGAGEKIPFVGTGGLRRTQQGQRIDAIKDMMRDFGAGDAQGASDAVMHDLVSKRSADITKYTGLKGGVINSLSGAGAVPVTRAAQAIDDQIRNMESLKLPELAPVIEKMQGWKAAMEGQSLDKLELVRKQIGESFKDPTLAAAKSTGEKALNAIYGPLREDMGDFIKTNGQRSDYTKWAIANKRLSEMSGELSTGALKSVLKSGDATPEDVRKMLFSAKPSDVKTLYSNLSAEGKTHAKVAIMSKVAADAGGIENLSPAKYLTAVKKTAAPLGVFFDGAEAKRLKGLGRALELTAHADKAALAPPTGVQAIPILGADILIKTLGGPMGATAGAVAIGGMARLYESAPIRNILMKLPTVRAGSPEEAALFKRFTSLAYAQNTTQQEPN